ncbi:MAG: hypothetical protein ACPGLV_06520 [Bacteroidia bacterium]
MSDLLDDHLLEDKKKSYKFSMGIALMWCAIYLIGAIFKLMHWPGYTIFILCGSAGLMAYSLSALITLRGKSLPNNFSLGVAVLLIVFYLIKVAKYSSFNFLVSYAVTTVIFFVFSLIIKFFRNRKGKQSI